VGWIRARSVKGSTNGAMAGMVKPLARSRDLIIEEVDNELLLYDQSNDSAHCLSADAARVWRACDGHTTIEALTAELDLDAETVTRALAELESHALLEAGHSGAGLTRRDITTKAAKVGAAAAVVPLIVSIRPAVAEGQMTPTIEDCAQYNAESCAGCCQIIGCCCCCQGGGDCKLCFPTTLCPEFTGCEAGSASGCSCTGKKFVAGTVTCEEVVPKGQQGSCGCTYPG
jgi:hypothetical protein